MNGEYEVPKHQMRVRLRLLHQEPAEGLLHLSEAAARHSGREFPSDLLNGDGRFLSLHDPSGTGFRLVRRESLVWLSMTAGEEQKETGSTWLVSEDDPEATVERVRIVFGDGSDVAGTLRWVLPAGQRRVRDFLEQADLFFPLYGDDRVTFVNRERLVSVEPA